MEQNRLIYIEELRAKKEALETAIHNLILNFGLETDCGVEVDASVHWFKDKLPHEKEYSDLISMPVVKVKVIL